jgi:hypothetical protein
MTLLKRFWFKFAKSERPTALNIGCGITAYDLPDAEGILREKVFPSYGEQAIQEVVENVDIATLEEKHVRPNMGNPAARGVWFPLL